MLLNDNLKIRREFQKSIDINECRKKRLDDRLSLRKKIRHERLIKFRKNSHLSKKSKIPSYIKISNLNKFVSQINTTNYNKILKGVTAIRQLLSLDDGIDAVSEKLFKTNVVSKIIQIIDFNVPKNKNDKVKKINELQFQAACKLIFFFFPGSIFFP